MGWRRRGLKFGFGRDVQTPIFKEIVTHLYTNRPNLGEIARFFPNFLKVEPILAQIWENLKNQPIHIQISSFQKASFKYQEADFASHVGGTSPKGLLY